MQYGRQLSTCFGNRPAASQSHADGEIELHVAASWQPVNHSSDNDGAEIGAICSRNHPAVLKMIFNFVLGPPPPGGPGGGSGLSVP
jgi:hypothetical protein